MKKVMSIAGSDSGGGAGIQADLKTFAAFGVYGTSVITAITAQNTQSVERVIELSPDVVAAQIDSVVRDIGADAVKTGMLVNAAIVETVAKKIQEHNLTNLVVDPVMVAGNGGVLLRSEGVNALRSWLLPLALVVTPNLHEAEVLTGRRLASVEDMRWAAKAIAQMGPQSVVVKGGHLEGIAVDVLWDGIEFHEMASERVGSGNTHGTGCTFASAIAACLARGLTVAEAVAKAKEYVTQAIDQSFSVGQGRTPLNHFYCFWSVENALMVSPSNHERRHKTAHPETVEG